VAVLGHSDSRHLGTTAQLVAAPGDGRTPAALFCYTLLGIALGIGREVQNGGSALNDMNVIIVFITPFFVFEPRSLPVWGCPNTNNRAT
jgi:hypothetical protein